MLFLVATLTGLTALQNPLVLDRRLPTGFGHVERVTERSDGTVLLADPLGAVLVNIDFDDARADTIGRVGGGPGEYRQPDAVFGLAGDSALLVDLGNGRLSVLGPDNRFGATEAMTRGGRPGPGMVVLIPHGVDTVGSVFFGPFSPVGPDGRWNDQRPVLRFDRVNGAIDTVAFVAGAEIADRSGGSDDVTVTLVPLGREDGWAVAPDGWIGIVRVADYHVDWIAPDGRTVNGPRIEYDPVRIGRAEKEAWASSRGLGLAMGGRMMNGNFSATFSRRPPAAARTDLDELPWPQTLPPFDPDGVWSGPTGTLWVTRRGRAEAPVALDVFDRTGRRVARYSVPPGRRLVGVGRRGVYVVARDDLDLQYVERYRRPRSR